MFAADTARLVIGAQMRHERAATYLDTVFTVRPWHGDAGASV
jgi:hypothetical protein